MREPRPLSPTPIAEVPLPRAPLARVIAQARFPPILAIRDPDKVAGVQEELREAAQPFKETTATLKAADQELREVTRQPVQEMKETLKAAEKAADPRKLVEPAAETDPTERKSLAAGGATDAAPAASDEGAEPADESGSGPDAPTDEDESGSATGTAA